MNQLLIVSARDVKHLLHSYITIQEILANQASVFKVLNSASNAATFQAPSRISLQQKDATTLFMPARLQDEVTCKIVGVPNKSSGLTAATVVLDGIGSIKALVNATSLTALRTAAGSALATLAVHISSSSREKRITIFGSGQQALFHASLFSTIYSGSSLTFVSRSGLSDVMREELLTSGVNKDKFSTVLSQDRDKVEKIVSQADIIICCTPSQQALFSSKWVQPGTHIVLIGSYKPTMQEVEENLVHRACGRIIVDDADACSSEAGDLIKAGVDAKKCISLGNLLYQQPFTNLACGHFDSHPSPQQVNSVLAMMNDRLGQTKMGDVTMFKSVGVGLQDVAITSLVVRKAKEQGMGKIVDF